LALTNKSSCRNT